MKQINRAEEIHPVSYRRWESVVCKYRESLGHSFCHGMEHLLDKAQKMEMYNKYLKLRSDYTDRGYGECLHFLEEVWFEPSQKVIVNNM